MPRRVKESPWVDAVRSSRRLTLFRNALRAAADNRYWVFSPTELSMWAVCAFFLFILLGVANTWASDFDFRLINETARSFEGIYITASGNKDWDANLLLNGKVLAAAGKIDVRFKRDAKSETWDLNLVDDQGLSVSFDHLKLTNVDTITLKEVNGKISAEIE